MNDLGETNARMRAPKGPSIARIEVAPRAVDRASERALPLKALFQRVLDRAANRALPAHRPLNQGPPASYAVGEERTATGPVPSNLAAVASRVGLWRVPGDPVQHMVTSPDQDLRERHPEAVPLFDVAHRLRDRGMSGQDLPADLLEALQERAAILEHDAGDAPGEAWVRAVRLEQCRLCRYFTPDPTGPLTGIGACAVSGWAQRQDEAAGQLAEPCFDWRVLE